MPAYKMTVDATGLRMLLAKTLFPLGSAQVARLGEAVHRSARVVQARAVHNVSGYPVYYAGGAFKVSVRTGALKGSIEVAYPYGTLLTARVFVNGTHMRQEQAPGWGSVRTIPVSDYAGAIEWGHDAIDLKLTMKGKTVPFFASRGLRSVGPYSARGLEAVDPNKTSFGSGWVNAKLNEKLNAAGKAPMVFTRKGSKTAYEGGKKGGGAYFIAFRKVGNTGWIIPAAKPRSFMAAAAAGTADKVRLMLVGEVKAMFEER